MRVLLDTHAFIWWLTGSSALTQAGRDAVSDEHNEVFVSAASAWEITTKHRLGKLPSLARLAVDVASAVSDEGFRPLPITVAHAQSAGSLPGPHRDPFDRMLIAQALIESLVIVSNERLFDAYGARRLW